MRLDDLAAAIGLTVAEPYTALPVETISLDSRTVEAGALFAAIPGADADGARFITEAVAHGAACVLARTGTEWPQGVAARPFLLHDEPAQALARAAAVLAGKPPERLVAITGTNGKTSTAEFLRQFWELSGIRAASIGTLGVVGGPPSRLGAAAGLTTPDSITLSGHLAQLAATGVRAVAIEASSHGLAQYRLDGLKPHVAAFSNLTRDHLDYHGGIEEYRRAKLRLFAELLPEQGIACANSDMDAATLNALRDISVARRQTLRLGGVAGDTVRIVQSRPLPDGQIATLRALGKEWQLRLPLPGRYQLDNVVLAALCAHSELDALEQVLPLAERLTGVRGRMECCARLGDGSAVYVDYAHTPDALERLLLSLRPHALGRLVLVFGAGGDRDRGKRALMGEVAGRLADLAIVTDDNPRSEDPRAIRAEILAACPEALEIGDRAAAIAAGLEAIRGGDVLVVAGKGHEQGQIVGGRTLAFDDRAVIRRLAGITEHAA